MKPITGVAFSTIITHTYVLAIGQQCFLPSTAQPYQIKLLGEIIYKLTNIHVTFLTTISVGQGSCSSKHSDLFKAGFGK